jgi:hypothetical protein
MKAVLTGGYKAEVGAGAGSWSPNFLKIEAGAETNSFGSTGINDKYLPVPTLWKTGQLAPYRTLNNVKPNFC